MPTNFFTFSSTDISGALVIFNILLSFVISLTIALVHKKTHTGLSYSSSFFATLVLIGIIASVALMTIQNNIFGALGLFGMFALIRFRTILKETRDIAFVFFSLVEGMAVGLNSYAVAIISTTLVCLIAYILSRFPLGSTPSQKLVLLLSTTSALDYEKLREQFREYKISLDLLTSKKQQENLFEYTLSLQSKDASLANKALSKISSLHSIKSYDLISGKDSLEY